MLIIEVAFNDSYHLEDDALKVSDMFPQGPPELPKVIIVRYRNIKRVIVLDYCNPL